MKLSQNQLREELRLTKDMNEKFLLAERVVVQRLGDKFRSAKITQVGEGGFHALLSGDVLATFFPWKEESSNV